MGTLAIKTWDETKTKEFHRLGYLNMTEAELWEYMQEKSLASRPVD